MILNAILMDTKDNPRYFNLISFVLIFLSMIVYMILFLLFYDQMGRSVGMFILIPIITATARLGFKYGIPLVLFSVLMNFSFEVFVGKVGIKDFFNIIGIFGSIILISIGAFIGKFRELWSELREQYLREEKTRENIIRSQKLEALSLLAGGLAHDFNNILFTLMGNISLAKASSSNQEELLKNLNDAEESITDATAITKQFLTFSKGGKPIKKKASISKIIIDSVTLALKGSNVNCRFSFSESLWATEIDEGQIKQVFTNLAFNAKHAIDKGGNLEIRAENIDINEKYHVGSLEDGKYVIVSVKDDGRGIPDEIVARIFDPYFTTKEDGSGLGLAVSYSIIKNHNGLITVESAPSVGTTFYIYLPASDEPLIDAKKREGMVFKGGGKILIMDDDERVRELLTKMLTHLGYESSTAKNGEEAIESYRVAKEMKAPFNAVIMDLIIVGGMGGKDAMTKLLEIDPMAKAIATSGYSNDPIISNFKEYGFLGAIPKPYNIQGLSVVLRDVLNIPS